MNDDTTLAYWLALSRMHGIGFHVAQSLIKKFGSLNNLFAASFAMLRDYNLSTKLITSLQSINWKLIERDLSWKEQPYQHIVCIDDQHYPFLLKEIASPPLVLFVHGDINVLHTKQIAVVGSRNPTSIGCENAYAFSKALADSGYTITSGLALGIDGASHRGAVENNGQTLAVLGTGINNVYPKRHEKLARSIIKNGALVSEFRLDMPAYPENFPRRNRIISGLSLGVVVVEATVKSGSLITARYAGEQGREVFAIPGSIHNPLSRGCHYLIGQGAKLTMTVYDILQELESFENNNYEKSEPIKESQPIDIEDKNLMVLNAVDESFTSFDQIVKRCGLTSDTVSSILLTLELQEKIKSLAGGYCKN